VDIPHILTMPLESLHAQNSHPLLWMGSQRLLADATRTEGATLQAREFQILTKMVVEGDVKPEFWLARALQTEHRQHKAAGKSRGEYRPHTSFQLFATLYGSAENYENVGCFSQACGVYLQDPINCGRNVRYLNPHRLPHPSGDTVMTFDFKNQELSTDIEELTAPVDLYAQLDSDDFVPEAEQPVDIDTPLKR
jgi:hypothetical protein